MKQNTTTVGVTSRPHIEGTESYDHSWEIIVTTSEFEYAIRNTSCVLLNGQDV